MIFVTVGSRNYPFDRVFLALDKVLEDGVVTSGELGAYVCTDRNFVLYPKAL